MATGRDVLRLIVDADSSGAVKEFDKLGKGIKSSVGEADKAATGLKASLAKAFDGLQAKSGTVSGIFDKLGISSAQAGAAIASAIPAAGVAAAAGLVAFAAKGVAAFQEVALAAGKFADTTGLSVDQASRYIAVADDIGVGANTIQSAFLKMEKAMGTNKAAFGDLIATTKSGGVDLSQTFLNAITHLQGIKDPIDRATESSKLFGKGFSEVSELIGTDAGKLKQSLADVSDAQVINPGELAKARDYRAAMDNLGDAVRDLSIKLGESLVPTLTAAADAVAKLVGWWQVAANFDKNGGIFGALTGFKVDFQAKSWGDFIHKVDDGKGSLDAAGSSLADVKAQIDAAATGASGAVAPYERVGAALVTVQGNAGQVAKQLEAMGQNSFEARAAGISHALDEQAAAAKRAADALTENTNAQLAAFDATFAVKDAQDQFAKSLMAAETLAASGTATQGELTQAYDDQAQKAEKAALAIQVKAEKDAIASGKALTAKQSNDLLIATLQAQAAQASGPTAAALNGLIANLQNVGAQHPQPTVTVNDQATGPLADIKAAVHTVDALRAQISVTADTSSARSSINRLIDGLNVIHTATGGGILYGHIAKGTDNWRGGLAMVGELGPELVYLPKGAQVKTAAETKSIMAGPTALPTGSGTSSGNVVQITVNGAVDPYSTARQIQTILAKGGYAGFSAKAA